MKKLFLTLVVAVAMVMTANANGYEYLTIQKSDGTMISLASSGLTITFENGNLIATQNGETTTLELNSLSKMFFAETTDIQMPSNALETGDVFDLQGRRVASKVQLKNLQNQLPKGIYIVKNGQKTVKVTIK